MCTADEKPTGGANHRRQPELHAGEPLVHCVRALIRSYVRLVPEWRPALGSQQK
jgi:hypothetical protein